MVEAILCSCLQEHYDQYCEGGPVGTRVVVLKRLLPAVPSLHPVVSIQLEWSEENSMVPAMVCVEHQLPSVDQ